jgi:hypothetical protein
MPRVNRFRVSNIKLDKGMKIIGDKIWEPNGLSTLFLLENGGGKTSVIQLLHQVILPNHDIQGRKLKSIVGKGNTINVAVEWIPDNDSQPMFITGFSFHNYGVKQGKSNTTYDYFNYIVERDTTETLSLETLPFVSDGKITPNSTLHSFLKKDVNTQVFSSNHTYQDVLEQYGILASEWRNISKVNGAEAGVTAFFDKADKTQTLIERLLIPAFLDNLFSNEEEKNAIINAFKVYKDRLLELPLLEKNLNDFEVVMNNADEIIDATENYIKIKKELESTQMYLSQLFQTVQIEEKQNQELILKLNKELTDIEVLKKGLSWKIESYKVHLAKLELNEATSRYNEVDSEREDSKKIIGTLQRNVNEQNAAKHYEEYKEYDRKVLELDGKLHAASLEVGEKLQELNETRERVSGGYHFIMEQNRELERAVTKNLQQLKQNIKGEKQALKETQNVITETKVKKGKLHEFIEQYDQENSHVNQVLGELKKETIEESKKVVEEKITKQKAILQEKNSLVEELENQHSLLKLEIQNKNHEMTETKRIRDDNESAFENFTNEEHQLKNDLNRFLSIYARENLFEQQDIILNKLHRNKEELNKEVTRLSIKIEQVDQIKKSIDQTGFHIHPEIESIKQFLASKELFVLSGIEWLVHATTSQEKKQELVKKNPLLPFSLLIEENKIKEAKRLLSSFKEELNVPLFFLTKQGLEEGMNIGNFILLQQNVYVFHQFNVRFSKEDWENWAVQLEEESAAYQEQRKELKIKEQDLIAFESKLKQFWSSYSTDTRPTYVLEIAALDQELENLQEEIKKLTDNMECTRKKKEKVKKECTAIQDNITDTEKILYRVQDIISRYRNIHVKKNEYLSLGEELEQLEDIEAKHQNAIEQYEGEEEQENNIYRSIESKIQDLKRDFIEYELERNVESIETNLDEYEKEKYLLKELNGNYSAEKQQLDLFRNTKTEYERLKQNSEDSIKKLTYSIDFFKKGNLSFQPALLEQFEVELSEEEERFTDIQSRYDKLRDSFIKKQERYKAEEEKIDEVYGEEPYGFSHDHQNDYELFIQEKNKVLKREANKQEEEKTAQQLSFKYNNTLTELENYREFFVTVSEENKLLAEGEWIKDNPMKDVHRVRKTFDEKREDLRTQDMIIREKIQAMHLEIEQTGNPHLLAMSRDFTNVLESSKGNYEVMIENFYSVLKAMDKFKESLEFQRAQSEEGRNELIEMMFERGELLYKNTCELPKYSHIEEQGLNISLFTIRWPKYDVLDCKHKLRMFVDEVLTELTERQEKGDSQELLDQLFQDKVNEINILNCYADIDRCVLKALKPRNAQLAEMKEYFTWDEVAGWSNGEKHASRMAMFITLNTFIRKKRFSQENSWKFLIADNPFGEASADHVVKPMVILARKTNTQLFCLTGIEDKRIQMEFDTVISNQYVEQRGRLFLHSETETKESLEMESLFYSKQQGLKL